jgi:aryl-alcohol dehydrogenase-like predicted oxidoreductase
VNYRKLGKTDLIISEISFGCQSIAGGLYYKNNSESIKTPLEAFDLKSLSGAQLTNKEIEKIYSLEKQQLN